MEAPEPKDAPVGEKLERRKKWERERAQGRKSDNDRPVSYEPIIFPDAAGLRHAAMVICGAHVNRKNGTAEAREVAWALGIPQIMAEGGDGRKIRVQRTPLDDSAPKPIGYGEENGRAAVRKSRKAP